MCSYLRDTTLATNIAATGYSDVSAVPGTTYYYSVAGTNVAGQSDFSSQASATIPVTPPTFISISLSGTNLIISGTNGTAGMNYLVLMSSNLILPFTNWTVVATNAFGPGGGFNFTNTLNPVSSQQYYLLELP